MACSGCIGASSEGPVFPWRRPGRTACCPHAAWRNSWRSSTRSRLQRAGRPPTWQAAGFGGIVVVRALVAVACCGTSMGGVRVAEVNLLCQFRWSSPTVMSGGQLRCATPLRRWCGSSARRDEGYLRVVRRAWKPHKNIRLGPLEATVGARSSCPPSSSRHFEYQSCCENASSCSGTHLAEPPHGRLCCVSSRLSRLTVA